MRNDRPVFTAVALTLCAGALCAVAAPINNGSQYVEHNGTMYRVEKSIVNGEPVTTYSDGRGVYTTNELRAMIAAEPPRIFSADAEALLGAARANDVVELMVVLRPQPAAPIGREVFAQIEPEANALTERIHAVTRRFLPQEPVPHAQMADRELQPIPADALEERRAHALAHDALVDGARAEIARRIEIAAEPNLAQLRAFVTDALGGEVYADVSVPMSVLFVRINAGDADRLAAHPLVAHVDVDHPGEPELDNHAVSLGLTTGFWANGITGGIHDVGVLDTGVQQNHPNLTPNTWMSNMGVNDTSTHGTGMAGIMASTHPTWRGMSYGVDTIVVAQAGSISTSMPGMHYIASTGVPENVNYSFGNGTATGTDYTTTDQFFDGVISTFGFMVSKSTGNGGFGSGSPTITRPAPAYNLMASANMDDFNNTNRTTHRITSSSSRGPTAGGRKKPDITSPGNNSFSTHPGGGFANIGGTSSASPHTGSGVVLLYDAGVTNVMAGKAILLNSTDAMNDNETSSTADDTFVNGSFWNRRYGWGYMHLGRAYQQSMNYSVQTITGVSGDTPYRLYSSPLMQFDKATLVWQRHVAYNGATFPTQIESLSDLDLYAYRESNNGLLAQSVSAIDNVEQLHVNENTLTVLKVKAFNNFDPDIPQESFALATTQALTARTGPAFSGSISTVEGVDPGADATLNVLVQNTGDLRAHNVTTQLLGATIVSTPGAASINAGGQHVFQWVVTAPNEPGEYPITVNVSTSSYGESFTGVVLGTLVVGGCPGDTNGDGVVDFTDFTNVLNQYGTKGVGLLGDLNGDGVVDFADFSEVLANYGADCN